jgi:hypothetical protein
MSRLSTSISVLGLAIALTCPTVKSQSELNTTDAPQGKAVLTKLAPPIYPAIARAAHIMGDVEVALDIRSDGSVQSAAAINGPPLLVNTAVDSARQSQFQCQGRGEAVTPIHLSYTFQLVDSGGCCAPIGDVSKGAAPNQPTPGVTQSQNHVTIVAYPECICDPAIARTRVRSLRCLYLWKCRTL